jgi:hypothetical protein
MRQAKKPFKFGLGIVSVVQCFGCHVSHETESDLCVAETEAREQGYNHNRPFYSGEPAVANLSSRLCWL